MSYLFVALYVCACTSFSTTHVSVRLQLTPQRLGAAAASTARSAGYFRSCPHVNFSGVTAAVAPNRMLHCWHLSIYCVLLLVGELKYISANFFAVVELFRRAFGRIAFAVIFVFKCCISVITGYLSFIILTSV